MDAKLRFIDGLLQTDSDEPGGPGQNVTDLVYVGGLLEEVKTTTNP